MNGVQAFNDIFKYLECYILITLKKIVWRFITSFECIGKKVETLKNNTFDYHPDAPSLEPNGLEDSIDNMFVVPSVVE